MKNYVAYYRVSTQMQGIEGLGIQSQINAVTNYVNGNIIATYSEVETSTRKKKRIENIKQLNMLKLIMLYWLLQN
jgi:DNA invertase Pin-like site-specific DNA recombinase